MSRPAARDPLHTRLARRLGDHARVHLCAALARLGVPARLDYGGFDILLPATHALPDLLRHHPRYDHFLPQLAASLQAGDLVVDVGANVGDTLAGMVAANPDLSFACIEPDPEFLGFLTGNVDRIRAAVPQLRAVVVPALVGLQVSAASLTGSDGTRHALPGPGPHRAETLDALLAREDVGRVRLLKSDVDGFDHDVLMSAQGTLRRDRPLLFFECQYVDAVQKDGFERTIAFLCDLGYVDWTVFDNYGEVMLRTRQVEAVRELIGYVWRQNEGRATRTVHYLDILAACPADAGIVRAALARHGVD